MVLEIKKHTIIIKINKKQKIKKYNYKNRK